MTHEQQLREAIKVVMELTKGNGFMIDDSDVMDGNIYITLYKPLNEDNVEDDEDDEDDFKTFNEAPYGDDADMEAQDHDTFGNNKI